MNEIRYCPACDEMKRVDAEGCCVICEHRTTGKTREKLDREIADDTKRVLDDLGVDPNPPR